MIEEAKREKQLAGNRGAILALVGCSAVTLIVVTIRDGWAYLPLIALWPLFPVMAVVGALRSLTFPSSWEVVAWGLVAVVATAPSMASLIWIGWLVHHRTGRASRIAVAVVVWFSNGLLWCSALQSLQRAIANYD